MPDCEAEERILRAVYEIEQMTGSWIIDLAKLKNILTGRHATTCTHEKAPTLTNNVQLSC